MSLNVTRKFVLTCYLFGTLFFKFLAKKKGLMTIINLNFNTLPYIQSIGNLCLILESIKHSRGLIISKCRTVPHKNIQLFC